MPRSLRVARPPSLRGRVLTIALTAGESSSSVPPMAIGMGIVLAVAFQLGFVAAAHELGATQVAAEFRGDGTFQIDIAVDPDVLLTRLEAYGRRGISAGLEPAERDRRIAALGSIFLDRVEIRFDGNPRRPRFEYLPARLDTRKRDPEGLDVSSGADSPVRNESIEPSHVRLTGRQPDGAGTWTFLHGAAIGTYAMRLRVGDGPVQELWLEGGRASGPLPLVTNESIRTWARRIGWPGIALCALCWHARRVVGRLREGRDNMPA